MDWTPIITEFSHIIHEVVAQELQDDGDPVNASVVTESAQTMHQAWRQESLTY